MIEKEQQQLSLTDPDSLEKFFLKCNEREQGVEPDWEDHKRLILESFQSGSKPLSL